MNVVLRYVFISIFLSSFLATAVLSITWLAVPTFDWTFLWKQEIGSVPFFGWILGTVILVGAIVGVSVGYYWKQQYQQVDRTLAGLVKGQQTLIPEESLKDLGDIGERIQELQEKMRQQAELSQRLATERAEEREKSLQEIVVQERNRLARELHDSVSQQLFAASMMMSAINQAGPPKDPTMNKRLKMVEKMIQQSQLEMRALLLHLRPVALKGKSLKEGVEELLKEMQQKVPMNITWKLEEIQVDKGIEDQLFRILQESVSNTFRHADASSLHVMLIERDETVILRVVDDGIGFDIEKVKTGSYGLTNMRERAVEVGGTLKIISLPNEGTQLEVKVPIIRKGGKEND